MEPVPTTKGLEDLAAAQAGRIARRQLAELGFSRQRIRSWVRRRRLIPTVPKHVYALAYRRTDREALLWDALLYAGPDAGLTGACGAHQLGLLFYEPKEIKVQTPRDLRTSPPQFVVLDRRGDVTEDHDGLPYAPLPDLLIELGNEGNIPILRRTLEALDYHRMLDVAAAHHACVQGRNGGVALKTALTKRLPQLARCKSPLEVDFLIDIVEAHHLPLPRVNEQLHGVQPDMYWPELNLVVELDGGRNHGTGAQKRKDAAKDAHLRSKGITVVRLTSDDVHHDQAATMMTLASHGLAA